MKVNSEELNNFMQAFWVDNKFPNQRLGQAFCNHFSITDSELFYDKDNDSVCSLLARNYLST